MPKEKNKIDINKHENDINTLKKQNVIDLLSIKELYKRIEELGEKITQIKYIDNTIVNKLKKEYEKLKKIILDENIQIKLTNDIEKINSQMDNMTSYVTPQMFGAKGDYNEDTGIGSDDIVALENALNFGTYKNNTLIDLGGKKYYISRPLKLTRQNRTFINGSIYSDGNVIENGMQWCSFYAFNKINLISKNGYAIYISNSFNGEFNHVTYTDCYLEGGKGAFCSYNSEIGFSQTFIRVSVKSNNGNGFSGVKGPGTTFIGCDNRGLPNGALFHNCSDCKIISSDSQAPMKHAVLIDKYIVGAYYEDCNFEHCTHESALATTSFKEIEFNNTTFSRKTSGYTSVDYPLILRASNLIKLNNVDICNYDDNPIKIQIYNNPNIITSGSTELTVSFESAYRNKVKTLPKQGIIKDCVEELFEDGNKQAITKYNTNEPIMINTKHIGSFFNNTLKVSELDKDNCINFQIHGMYNTYELTNSFTGDTINGIKNFLVDQYCGFGTIITIYNNSGKSLIIKNKSGIGQNIMTLSGSDFTLTNGSTINLIFKKIDTLKRWVEF